MPSTRVVLDESRAVANLRHEGDEDAERWFLDTGASNHMTGNRAAFTELDTNVTGSVKFGDNSAVSIEGRGTILFACKSGEHRALTGVYYIPQLRSNIISLGQLDERGCEVLIKSGILRIRDREQKLLAKVERGSNRLYVLELHIARPVCLATRRDDDAWRWHERFGHQSFDALAGMARHNMVKGLPLIDRVSKLCDSCLAGKQRRAPFPKKANFRAEELLELVYGDLCGPITPARMADAGFFSSLTTAAGTCG
jgi:hypothetical protein